MFRTISIIARMSRMSSLHHSRIISPAVINCVRFKYQGSGGGDRSGRRKAPQATYIAGDEDLPDEPAEQVDFNLLEDKLVINEFHRKPTGF